jgi:hypothetical protein
MPGTHSIRGLVTDGSKGNGFHELDPTCRKAAFVRGKGYA